MPSRQPPWVFSFIFTPLGSGSFTASLHSILLSLLGFDIWAFFEILCISLTHSRDETSELLSCDGSPLLHLYIKQQRVHIPEIYRTSVAEEHGRTASLRNPIYTLSGSLSSSRCSVTERLPTLPLSLIHFDRLTSLTPALFYTFSGFFQLKYQSQHQILFLLPASFFLLLCT